MGVGIMKTIKKHALNVVLDVREKLGELEPAARLTINDAEAISKAMDIVHTDLHGELGEEGDYVPWLCSVVRQLCSVSTRALYVIRGEHLDLDKGPLYRSLVKLIAILTREAEALRAELEPGGEG